MCKTLLSKSGLDVLTACRLVLETIEHYGNHQPPSIAVLRQILLLGVQQYKLQQQSQSLENVRERYLENKPHLHKRTVDDILQLTNKFFRSHPNIKSKLLCDFDPEFCEFHLKQAFTTACQRRKALSVLRALFNWGVKKGWAQDNPWLKIDLPNLCEQEIEILLPDKVKKLLNIARTFSQGETMPPIALMTYAGIRPEEIKRLSWNEINLEEKIITLRPHHTKTGGCRHVTIPPILSQLLRKHLKAHPIHDLNTPIVPKGWIQKWRKVRCLAGWVHNNQWQPDTLRHTYASYHLSLYKNIPLLQVEMGHSSSSMLQTRYLNMKGITKERTHEFWTLVKK